MDVVGVDIGGTFTDLVGCVNGRIVMSKTSTIPDDPTRGIIQSLRLANCDVPSLNEVLHGSTIAINTVLERKGARAAVIATKGFRDIYAIGRGNRIEAFNLFFKRPRPLVDRDMTVEVNERMTARGDVLVPLNDAEVEQLADWLIRNKVEAVAVCLLHSYVNPDHERRIGEIIKRLVPGLFVTLSHEILREYREYERTSTTTLNAYVGPRVSNYLSLLDSYLRQERFGGRIQLMRSNGGVMSLSQARRQPVSMLESGPVAGMIAAGRLATSFGLEKCIGFDMGGTTAKASLIIRGTTPIEDGYVIGDQATGQPMQLPVVDIIEIGAGGGSIAWCDELRCMHVGPQSAGADPGPACYGKGGVNPVVTDANLILGRINPRRFLNGGMALDLDAAAAAMESKIGSVLGLNTTEAALGVIKIADAAMSLAVRAVSVNRGIDPRDTTLIAFGGGGPLHACSIAREISIPRVLIPKLPGAFSALGMLMASWRQDLVRTLMGRLGSLRPDTILGVFQELETSGRQQLRDDEIPLSDAQFQYYAALRYTGQEHALPIPVGDVRELTDQVDLLRDRFSAEHEQRYGQSAAEETIEIVSVRLAVTATRPNNLADLWLNDAWAPESDIEEERRDVVFDAEAPLSSRVLWRPSLGAGTRVVGPAVIEEPSSTTLLHEGDVMTVTEAGHLLIEIGAAK